MIIIAWLKTVKRFGSPSAGYAAVCRCAGSHSRLRSSRRYSGGHADFLDMVKGAEERNLLKDVSEKDDSMNLFKSGWWAVSATCVLTDDEFIPQMVREYHKRYVEIKEKDWNGTYSAK
jgi:hypothetical protein